MAHNTLNLHELQSKNEQRAKEWSKNQTAPVPLSFNGLELVGEIGEAFTEMLRLVQVGMNLANTIKKHERTNLGLIGGTADLDNLQKEIGDVVICCSLIARKLNFSLSEAVIEKFNTTSDKHKFKTKLDGEIRHHEKLASTIGDTINFLKDEYECGVPVNEDGDTFMNRKAEKLTDALIDLYFDVCERYGIEPYSESGIRSSSSQRM